MTPPKRRRFWPRALLALLLALLAGGAWLALRPDGLDEYARRHFPPAPAGSAVTATWFGTTAVLIRDGSHALFVDPFFTRPEGLLPLTLNRRIAPDEELIRLWLRRAGVQRLDAVLVSHSHYDHAMDAGVVARLTGATLAGSASTLNVGRGAGLAEAQLLDAGGRPLRFGSFAVRFVGSRHAGASGGRPTGDIVAPLRTPAAYLDYKQGGTYSILIEHPVGTVLHHGSAGFVPGALQNHRADVALLGVAIIDDLPVYLREVVNAVGARRVVPVHWDDFTRSLDQPLRTFPLLVNLAGFFDGMRREAPDLEVRTFELGQPSALFAGLRPAEK